MLQRILLLALLASPVSLVYSQTTAAQDAKLRELLDLVWDFEIQESPLLATNIGDPRGQDRLADESLDAIERRTSRRRDFLAQLDTIPIDSVSTLAQVDHELLRRRLDSQLASHQFRMHLMPISKRDGFHIEFPELPRLMNPKSEADFTNYIARLNDFGRYADQHIVLLRNGIDAGLTQPAIIMRDSVKQAESQIVDDPNESLLLTTIGEDVRNKLGEQTWNRIADEIRDAITDSVIPGYQRFATFLRTEYLPACRGPIAASALPDGRAFYQNRVRHFTTLPLSADELHATGIRENARIR
ncbi:MAG: DUF885 domain-containing protein, partial [Pirellulaceae bacterium]|nr:DUF885 domain-containing protein [Pirellulaceae bacterium]